MVTYEILADQDKALIHERSLWLLETTGVQVKSSQILTLMAANGFDVNRESQRIRFPRRLVEAALKSAPQRFTLGGLDEAFDMHLGEGNVYLATDGQGCYAADLTTGERRESTMADLVEGAIISDQLDYIHCFWPLVTAHDVALGSRTIHELVACWSVSSKHFQSDCYNVGQAKYYAQILRAIFHDDEIIKRRHPFSLVCCPVTPLTFEGDMLEGTVALGALDVPVVILPMPISGTSSPMSMLSTVIQNNAEVLAGLTILQTAHKGRPVIYGAAPGILDMSTSLFCVGSPEGGLQNAACAEMAKRYRLPVLACGGGADGKEPGIQTTLERIAGLVPICMVRPDIICGVGLTDMAQCLYREELVINEDIVGYCQRLAAGINGGAENDLTELAARIGPGGNFLAEESTVRYLRSGEQYFPKVLCRESYEGWQHSPRNDIMTYAKHRVRELLAAPRKVNFAAPLQAELRRILRAADAEIGGGN